MARGTNYRPDIDGLRALAILSVVVFHAAPHLLPGGFTGVDVFFVVSGFLITSVILSGLEDRTFSLLDFYARRIRRILPALLVVLLSALVAGWFVLFALEYRELGRDVAAGAGFVSNIVDWSRSGYFDDEAHTQILLHLWSLGIEEQFYLVWPALTLLAWRYRNGVMTAIVAVLVLSFAANLYLTEHAPVAAFYLPLPRFWELMVGCALAHATSRGWRLQGVHAEGASVLGLVLIVAGFGLIDQFRAFPGWWALLPTLGTALVIAAGAEARLNRFVLASPPLVGIGLISYPLYLWHWPMLVFGHIVEAGDVSRTARLSAIAASFVAAIATYYLVEKGLRRSSHGTGKALALLGVTLCTGTIGYVFYAQHGLAGRLSRDPQREAFVDYFDNARPEWAFATRTGLRAKFRDECNFFDITSYLHRHETSVPLPRIVSDCTERDPAKPHAVLLWGDSHAQHLYWGLKQNLPADWQILQVASSGCLPDPDVEGPSNTDYCQQSNWTALQTIATAHPDVVLVAHGTGQSLARFAAIEEKLKSLGVKRGLFAGPTPHWRVKLPGLVARKLWPNPPRRTFVGVNQDLRRLNADLKSGFKESEAAAFVDLQDVFCSNEGCLVYLGDDVTTGLTSMDDGHLLPIASDFLARQRLVPMIVAP